MVLADMLFAEGLRVVHGLGYDWTARKIWPLLREASAHTGQQLLTRTEHPAPGNSDSESSSAGGYGGWSLNLPFLRALLSANMRFVLLGDEREWRELIGASEAAEVAFAVYKRKFAPFFVADYEWTDRNGACVRVCAAAPTLFVRTPPCRRCAAADMGKQAGLAAWWATVARLRDSLGLSCLDIQSVDEYAAELGHPAAATAASAAASTESPPADWTPQELVSAVFSHSWSTLLLPQLSAPHPVPELPRPARLFRAFARHSLGQYAVFSHIPAVHQPLQASIVHALEGQLATLARAGGADLSDVRRGRAVYGAFIDQLVRELRVTADDAAVFRQIFPLFEPRYVTYDANPDLYDSLAAVASRVLGGPSAAEGSGLAQPVA